MKSVKTVEVNDSVFAGGGLRDGDARSQGVISAVFERDNRVQAIHSPALKDHYHYLALGCLLCFCGADKKSGGKPQG
jgi:hypothetical protein